MLRDCSVSMITVHGPTHAHLGLIDVGTVWRLGQYQVQGSYDVSSSDVEPCPSMIGANIAYLDRELRTAAAFCFVSFKTCAGSLGSASYSSFS